MAITYVHKAPFLTADKSALQLITAFTIAKYASAKDSLSPTFIMAKWQMKRLEHCLVKTNQIKLHQLLLRCPRLKTQAKMQISMTMMMIADLYSPPDSHGNGACS